MVFFTLCAEGTCGSAILCTDTSSFPIGLVSFVTTIKVSALITVARTILPTIRRASPLPRSKKSWVFSITYNWEHITATYIKLIEVCVVG